MKNFEPQRRRGAEFFECGIQESRYFIPEFLSSKLNVLFSTFSLRLRVSAVKN